MLCLNLSGADIIHDRIPENIVLYFARFYVLRIFLDNNGKLCLVIQLVCQVFMCWNDSVRIICAIYALGEINCFLRL